MKTQLMDQGMVYNIQRYSIHDGPGIRTTVFLKSCPLRCFWCQNPESQHIQPELFVTEEKCVDCGACIAACPKGACYFTEDKKVLTDRAKCVGCGKCVEACAQEARSIMGKRMSVDEVFDVVWKDREFYKHSGGGVTVSGGDPVAQPGFAIAILKKCKEAGIHTTIETCAYTTWETFRDILEYTDMVYMDIKCMDPELHKKCTGVYNEYILENAKKTAELGKNLYIRTPVIPKFNDDREELKKIALFVRDELHLDKYELLKYNALCESKYVRLDKEFTGEKHLPTDAELESHMVDLRNMVGELFI